MSILAVGYFFATAGLLGLTFIRGLKLKFGRAMQLTAGLIIGIAGLTQIIFWQSWWLPFSSTTILITLNLITLGCVWWLKRRGKPQLKIKLKTLSPWLIWISGWLILWLIIWSRMLNQEADGLYAGWVNIWGDWAAHLSYTTSFAYGNNFPPQMPILIGAKFSYPFLADFLSAILIKLGSNLIPAMLIPSVLLSTLLVLVLTGFGREITKSFKVGKLMAILFLFNGGFGWWWWLKDIKTTGLSNVINNLPREYTHLEKLANIEWINVITSQVVPQRGFLLGFPIAVLVYLFLWRYWQQRRRQNLLTAGLLTAMLPLIHAHSLAIIITVGGGLGLIELFQEKNKLRVIRNWLWFIVPITIIALPQLNYFYRQSVGNGHFVKWFPGWLALSRSDGAIWFWLKNLGLMAVWPWLGLKLANEKLKQFSLPFWLVFVAANLWLFQPWEWDNTKFFIHWYLVASLLAAIVLIRLPKFIAILFLLITVWAGSLDVWRLSQYQYRKIRFWNNEQLALAEWVKNNTASESRFLTAGNHDHWLPTLTGRKILMGFNGWLWTYGINYGPQESAAAAIFHGRPEAKQKIQEYGLNYAVIGPMEHQIEPPINELWFKQNFPLIYQSENTQIYWLSDSF